MRIVLALVLLSLAIASAACGGGGSGERRTSVVAGFYPLAAAARWVGGERVEVTNLTPPGVEPHDLELSVADVERVRSADFVLLLGDGFQPALEDAAARAEGRTLDLLAGLEHREGDPHVWLDPIRYAAIVRRIGQALGARARAERMAARLRRLDGELERGLAECDSRVLVTSHAAFGYLADRYELEQIAISGPTPQAEPHPRDLERIARAVRRTGVDVVYVEPLISPRVAETVAREAGVGTAVLHPLEGLTQEEIERGEGYFSLMRKNLAVLRKGLRCR